MSADIPALDIVGVRNAGTSSATITFRTNGGYSVADKSDISRLEHKMLDKKARGTGDYVWFYGNRLSDDDITYLRVELDMANRAALTERIQVEAKARGAVAS